MSDSSTNARRQVAVSIARPEDLARMPRQVLIATRMMLLCVGLTYPTWCTILRMADPHSYDSVGQRVVIGGLCLVALALSWVPATVKYLAAATRTIAMILVLHGLFLVQHNPASMPYQLGLIIVFSVAGVVVTGWRAVVAFIFAETAGTIIVAWSWGFSANAQTLLATTSTIEVIVAMAVWRRSAIEQTLANEINAMRNFSEQILQNIPDPVLVRDEALRYSHVNAAFCRLVHREPSQVLGKTPNEIFVSDINRQMEVQQQALTDQPIEYELSFIDLTGKANVSLVKLSRIVLPDGQTGTLGVMRDITARQEMERTMAAAESLFRNAFEQGPVGMMMVDRNFRIQRVNKALCDLLGYSDQELLHRDLTTLTHPDDVEECSRKVMELYRGEVPFATFEKRYLHKSGRAVWVLASASPASETPGLAETFVAQVVDITARRQNAEALLQAKESAEAATRAKSAFLATMSHEIRTPMNGVMAALDLVMRGRLAESQRSYLQMARESAEGLLRIINDVLDLSKIEADAVTLRLGPTRLRHEMAAVVQGNRVFAQDKSLKLALHQGADLPSVVYVDAVRLRQVLTNLVGNALKFTEKGEVTLHVEQFDRVGDEVTLRFVVRDTGPGISLDLQERVFKPFIQGDTGDNRKYGGTGLGLAIAQQLVEKMGGEITLQSQLGHGSSFQFDLRAKVGESTELPIEPQVTPQPPRAHDASTTHVLLVDDHEINLILTRRLLEGCGYSVTTANSGTGALAVVRSRSVDVVLMDVQMPDMDGFEVTRAMHGLPGRDKLPVIGLTAQAMAGDRERCQQAGMVGYVTKPIDMATLDQSIRQVLPAQPPASTDQGWQERLVARLDGDWELLKQLVAIFVAESPAMASQIRAALDSGDFKQLEASAHRFKGVLLNLGGEEAAVTAAEIEALARAKSVNGLARLIDQLDFSVAKFHPALAQLLAEHEVRAIGSP